GQQRHLVLLEAHPRPAAVAEPAAGQLGLHVVDRHREPGRQALDDHHEALAVRLAGGEVAQHRRRGYPGPAGGPWWVGPRTPEGQRLGLADVEELHRALVGAAARLALLLVGGDGEDRVVVVATAARRGAEAVVAEAEAAADLDPVGVDLAPDRDA